MRHHALLDELKSSLARNSSDVLLLEESGGLTGNDLLETADRKRSIYQRGRINAASLVAIPAAPIGEFVTDLLAVADLEACVLPVDVDTTAWQWQRLMQNLTPTHVIRVSNIPSVWAGAAYADPVGIIRDEAAHDTRDGLSAILTSGTNGVQRAALRTADAHLAEVLYYADTIFATGIDQLLLTLPTDHTYAFGLVLAALCAGVRVQGASVRRPHEIISLMRGNDHCLFPTVPALGRILTRYAKNHVLPKSSISVLFAGAPLDAYTAEATSMLFGAAVGQVYGSTETGPISCLLPGRWEQAIESVGTPFPRVQVELAPSNVSELPGGRVHVRSPSIMSGYVADASAPSDRIATGDLAIFEEGRIRLIGRESQAINLAGVMVSPEEIEAALLQCPDVDQALVVGMDDAERTQVLTAILAPATVDLEAVKGACRRLLPAAKVPVVFEARDSLPSTRVGKVLRSNPAGNSPA